MATNTTNLALIKPSGTDKIRIAQINSNMDVIDAKIGPVGSTSLQAQVNGKLPLAGGTMTGSLGIVTATGNGQEVIKIGNPDAAVEAAICKTDATNRNSISFRQYTPDGSHRENFNLPSTYDEIDSNATYNILTSKNVITVSQGGTGQTTLDGAKIALGTLYAPGDTYAEAASYSARNVVPGLIAGSAKQILFRVTTPKSMANISNISVTALAGWFAGINGIIKDSNGDNAADNTNWLSQNGVAVAAYKKSDNTAIIRLTRESAFGNATNGPCNGMLAFALSFS